MKEVVNFPLLKNKVGKKYIDVVEFSKLGDLYVNNATLDEDILNLPDGSTLFAHDAGVAVSKVFPALRYSNKKHNLITVRDLPATEQGVNEMPPSILKWYANNATTISPRVQGIPIGLPPLTAQFNPQDGTTALEKRQWVERLQAKEKDIDNLVYVNHSNHTNPTLRSDVYSLFSRVPWATCKGGSTRIPYPEYIEDTHSHKYVVCPEGAGIDCHRVWESLYLGTTPIVKRSIAMSYFEELPIIFVDTFEEVNPKFLEEESQKIYNKSLEMLDMSYWADMILNKHEK